MSEKKYDVLTWDVDAQAFTPQPGLRRGPWSKWGIRTALRRLQASGYECHRGDASVLVERRAALAATSGGQG